MGSAMATGPLLRFQKKDCLFYSSSWSRNPDPAVIFHVAPIQDMVIVMTESRLHRCSVGIIFILHRAPLHRLAATADLFLFPYISVYIMCIVYTVQFIQHI